MNEGCAARFAAYSDGNPKIRAMASSMQNDNASTVSVLVLMAPRLQSHVVLDAMLFADARGRLSQVLQGVEGTRRMARVSSLMAVGNCVEWARTVIGRRSRGSVHCMSRRVDRR